MSATVTITSPRVATLRADLAAGQPDALAAFWREIAASGAPLIEPIPSDVRHRLVTFVYRAADAANVAVHGFLSGFDPARNQLHRLEGTDLWYRTYRARSDTRTTYRFAPNDPMIPLDEDPNGEEREAAWRTDPLNPQTFFFSEDSATPYVPDATHSVLTLPDAPSLARCTPRPDVPHGQVETHRLHSAVLGNERRIWVYTPPAYAPERGPYVSAVFFDGHCYQRLIPTPTLLDNLLADGRLPPVIAIFVDSLGKTRGVELPCNEQFALFVAQELMPWARERYAVTRDPSLTVVAGVSLGGLAAAFVGLRHSELFGNVLSQSGSFWRPVGVPADDAPESEWLVRQFVAAPRLPLRVYLDAGLLENRASAPFRPSVLQSNRHLRDVLALKGYPLHYAEFAGGHDFPCWQGTLADGLVALLG